MDHESSTPGSKPTNSFRPLLPRQSVSAASIDAYRVTAKPRKNSSHACNRCRLLRTRCSGGSRCDKCRNDGAVCIFGDRRREQNKKDLEKSRHEIGILQAQNHRLIQKLEAVAASPSLGSNLSAQIREVLVQVCPRIRSITQLTVAAGNHFDNPKSPDQLEFTFVRTARTDSGR